MQSWAAAVALAAAAAAACLADCPEDVTDDTLRRRVHRAELVFRGRALPQDGDGFLDSVPLWVEAVYKGAAKLSAALGGAEDAVDVNNKLVSVIGWGVCPPATRMPVLVFAGWDPAGNHVIRASDPALDPPTTWRQRTQDVVWESVGWRPWREWSVCSASCGGGYQERHRRCSRNPQPREPCATDGYSAQRRRCNLFACEGAVSPMHVAASNGSLGGGEFLSLTAQQLFPEGLVLKDFAILSTLRMDPTSEEHGCGGRGAVLSVNAVKRSRHQPFLYLQVAARALRLVHSPGDDAALLHSLEVPASLADGHWHRVALGLRENSAEIFVDCERARSEALRLEALHIPQHADILVGHLFQGEISEVILVTSASAAAEQCEVRAEPFRSPSATKSPARRPQQPTTKMKKKNRNN